MAKGETIRAQPEVQLRGQSRYSLPRPPCATGSCLASILRAIREPGAGTQSKAEESRGFGFQKGESKLPSNLGAQQLAPQGSQ